MATWAKIKFFYATMLGSSGSTVTCTQPVESQGGYSLDNIYNMLETNLWKSSNTSDVAINYDAGVGNIEAADYLAIIGHNLFTAGANIWLQYSDTGEFLGEETDVFASFAATADTVILKEFTKSTPHRYWRVLFTGLSAAPYTAICIWGNKTELDYASTSFDPYSQSAKATVNITQGGYMAGVHTKYIERSLVLNFSDADSALYGKVKGWWGTSGLKNFFVGWETANSPADVFLMHPSASFNNPMTGGGLYRDISISLKGRKE